MGLGCPEHKKPRAFRAPFFECMPMQALFENLLAKLGIIEPRGATIVAKRIDWLSALRLVCEEELARSTDPLYIRERSLTIRYHRTIRQEHHRKTDKMELIL